MMMMMMRELDHQKNSSHLRSLFSSESIIILIAVGVAVVVSAMIKGEFEYLPTYLTSTDFYKKGERLFVLFAAPTNTSHKLISGQPFFFPANTAAGREVVANASTTIDAQGLMA